MTHPQPITARPTVSSKLGPYRSLYTTNVSLSVDSLSLSPWMYLGLQRVYHPPDSLHADSLDSARDYLESARDYLVSARDSLGISGDIHVESLAPWMSLGLQIVSSSSTIWRVLEIIWRVLETI